MYRLRRLSKLNLRSRSIVDSARLCVNNNYGAKRFFSNEAKKPNEIDIQSSLLMRGYAALKEDIKNVDREYFILHLHIVNPPKDNKLVLSILEEIKARIWNVQHYFHLGIPEECVHYAPITWMSSEVDTVCSMYYCHTSSLLDAGVAEHTEQLIASVTEDIINSHPELGDDWSIEWFLTKHLRHEPYSPVSMHWDHFNRKH